MPETGQKISPVHKDSKPRREKLNQSSLRHVLIKPNQTLPLVLSAAIDSKRNYLHKPCIKVPFVGRFWNLIVVELNISALNYQINFKGKYSDLKTPQTNLYLVL